MGKQLEAQFCVQCGWRIVLHASELEVDQISQRTNQTRTKGHVDRDKDGQPDELQETNNVIFHPVAVSSIFTLSE